MAETASTARTFTDDEMEQMRAEVRVISEAEGRTLTELAREAGIAYGTFTGWVGGKYQGNNDRVAGDVQIWLASRSERRLASAALPAAPAFVATKTATRVIEVLQWAQIGPDMVVVAGGAGIGKTQACNHYAATNPNVWMATMQPATANVHTMLQAVAGAVGVSEKSPTRLATAVGERVAGTNGLVIVDEAQHLVTKALDQLRSLHDLYGIGVALVGNESVYGRLEGGEGRKPEFAQLYSRVGMRFTRPRPYADDICKLISAWNVEDADAVRLLKAIAGKPGALRGLTKTLRLASMLAAGDKTPPSAPHVSAAWARLSDTGSREGAA
ncbi:MAG: AAA family ATPase [Proteobacteria bacterium]|nr:AAA family ATPase [Pseudomonadota bacterium]